MLQNATSVRKSAPGPPNISDEHVSCTAPATENASFQILFKCPTPAIVLDMLENLHVLLIFDRCRIPCACRAKRHLNVQKWSEHVVCLTFLLRNVLRATTACTFSTSQLPKVVRARQFSTLLASKGASRHNGVHFFDSSTSKSGPTLQCFLHFDLEMCFAPQRRALFRHHNVQKWSKHGLFCTFWLGRVLRATTACNFLSLIWPHGSAPAALASLLLDPTFRPSEATNHWKKTECFATFLPFRAPGSSFFWDCLFFHLLFSFLLFSDSSHLCYLSAHIVGSSTSKLPSEITTTVPCTNYTAVRCNYKYNYNYNHTTLHNITLHCLHCITPQLQLQLQIQLQLPLHYTTLHYTTPHYTTLQHATLTTLHCTTTTTTLSYTTLH